MLIFSVLKPQTGVIPTTTTNFPSWRPIFIFRSYKTENVSGKCSYFTWMFMKMGQMFIDINEIPVIDSKQIRNAQLIQNLSQNNIFSFVYLHFERNQNIQRHTNTHTHIGSGKSLTALEHSWRRHRNAEQQVLCLCVCVCMLGGKAQPVYVIAQNVHTKHTHTETVSFQCYYYRSGYVHIYYSHHISGLFWNIFSIYTKDFVLRLTKKKLWSVRGVCYRYCITRHMCVCVCGALKCMLCDLLIWVWCLGPRKIVYKCKPRE